MTGRSRSTIALAIAAGLLLVLVLLDRSGVVGGVAEPSDAQSTTWRAQYREMAEAVAERRALIEDAPVWNSALAHAQSEWAKAREGLIVARTADLAEARFRDRVLALIQECGGESARVVAERDPGPEANPSIREVAMKVEFDVHDPAAAYRFVERLESIADPRANIESLAIDGPGRVQEPRTLAVSAKVRAVALVGEEP